MQSKKPVSIRMHESIKEDLEKLSKKHDISVNTLVNMMLMSMVEEIKSGKRQIVSEIVASSEN